MSWQIFLTISILSESFGRVVQRAIMKDESSDPIAFAVWFQFITGTLLLAYPLITGFKFNNLGPIIPNLILEPIIYGTMSILSFKAMKQTEASIFSILLNARVIIVVLAAVFFLHESFNLEQITGMSLILFSVILVSWKKESIKFKKGEILTLLAGIALALGTINDAVILRNFDVATYSSLGFIAPGLFIWVVNPRATPQIFKMIRTKAIYKVTLICLFFGTAFLTYNFAYVYGRNVAQLASIFPVTAVLTVLLAALILKERSKILTKIVAALISFLGVYLIN